MLECSLSCIAKEFITYFLNMRIFNKICKINKIFQIKYKYNSSSNNYKLISYSLINARCNSFKSTLTTI